MNNDKPVTSDENKSTATPAGKGDHETMQNGAAAEQQSPSEPQASTAASKSEPGPNQSKPQSPQKTGWTSKVLGLLLILLLAGGAGAWWFYGQHLPLPQQPEIDETSDLREELSQLRHQLSEVAGEREIRADRLEKQILEQQGVLTSHARRLRELATTTRTDWLLAEAEYLLRLGNQRLLTERNSENALALLLSADDILRELDEVKLLPVREALARNIVALKSQPEVDREGLYLRLKVLAEQAAMLSLVPSQMSRTAEPESESLQIPQTEASWYTPLTNAGRVVLAEAEKLVVVRRRANPVDPLLSPEQEKLLRLHLGVTFKQAQLALLGEQQAVYEASLAEVGDLLEDYFEVNDQSAQALIEQLKWLQEQPVKQVRPDISEGLNTLRDYIDSWHNRHQVESTGGL